MKKIKMELVFQVGMVVRSIDEKLANWRKYVDFDESSIKIKSTRDLALAGQFKDNTYNGQSAEFYVRFCRFDLGGIDFEMIEPLNQSGGDPYSDFLNANGEGLHHINVKMADREAFLETMDELGIIPLTSANGGGKSYHYFDLRELLGFIAEVGNKVVGPMAKDENE